MDLAGNTSAVAKGIELTPVKITTTTDNSSTIYLNGNQIGTTSNWGTSYQFSGFSLNSGNNILAIDSRDAGGIAAMSTQLEDASGNVVGTSQAANWKVFIADDQPNTSGYNSSSLTFPTNWTTVDFDSSDASLWKTPQTVSSYSNPWGNRTGDAAWIWSGNNSTDANNHDVVLFRYEFNTGSSNSVSISIDTSAPAAPSTPDLVSSSDTGSSNTDNITGDRTPTLNGTAEANSTIEFSHGSDSLGSTTTDGSGSWTFTVGSALLEGDHSITAKAKDTAGNESSASSALSIKVANHAPTGSVTISGGSNPPKQGESLSVTNSLADSDGLGTISYQWKRAGTAISGATGSTYTLVQADVGSAITVTASYTDVQGTAESAVSYTHLTLPTKA